VKTVRALALAAILALSNTDFLPAATWDGGLSHANFTLNDFWSTPNNWADGVPVSSPTTDVIFGLSGLRTTANQNLATPFFLRSLTFAGGANVTAVTGSLLALANNGTIVQNSATPVAFGLPLTLTGIATVTGTGNGTLFMNGAIGGASTVKFVGSAGGAGLRISLNGPNSYSGAALIGEIASGFSPVDVTFATDSAGGVNSIQFFNGNTVRANGGTRTISVPLGLFLNANGLTDAFTFGAGSNLNFVGPINVSDAPKKLQVDNAETIFAGSMSGKAILTKTGAGTLSLKASNQGFGGAWVVDNGTLKLSHDLAMPLTSVRVNTAGVFDLDALASVSLSALNGSGKVNLRNAALTVGAGNLSSVFAGPITANSGTSGSVTKTGLGNLTLGGTNSVFNKLTAADGMTGLTAGSMTLAEGLTVGGGASAAVLIMANGYNLVCGNNSGSIISGGANTVMTIDGPDALWQSGYQCVIAAGLGAGASSGALEVRNGAFVQGLFMVAGAGGPNGVGSLTVDSGASVQSAGGVVGFIDRSTGMALVTGAGSTWTNSSSLGLGGFSSQLLGGHGVLTVSNGAVVCCDGATTFWTNGNLINVDGGRFITDTLAAQNGPDDGTIALSDPDETTSALTIGIHNGSSLFPCAIANSTTRPGSISKVGSGTVTLSGRLGYTGLTRVLGGKLIVTRPNSFATVTQIGAKATFEINGAWGSDLYSQTTIALGATLTGSGTLSGAVTNYGLIDISDGNSLAFTGTVINNGAMRFRKGAAFMAAGQFINNGVLDIISAGSTSLPAGLVNNGTIRDGRSLPLSITKSDTLITLTVNPIFGGHNYILQSSTSLSDADFHDIGIPFIVSADRFYSTELGEEGPQRFYRFKID